VNERPCDTLRQSLKYFSRWLTLEKIQLREVDYWMEEINTRQNKNDNFPLKRI